ncbi:MAG: tRNA-2-methylthio-N6-dimethylallyladenosine synthase [Hyphomicrobiaceae bacterium]|jgi:tRNA-2-methylthio-N6-dimethylallyladenosine synthase
MSSLTGTAELADPATEKRLYLETYGCQMNVADSELILGSLARSGYVRTDDAEIADVIMLNTCAIRENAEQRVSQRVRALISLRRGTSRVRIGLAGCMAQHHRDELLSRIPGLDFVVGPDGYRRLPELLESDEPAADVHLDRRETYEDITPVRGEGVRAWLTIMRGCNRFCTFCVVPFVRGRERGLPPEVLRTELESIAAQGFREVTLLGQTVNAYKVDDTDFGALLRMAASIEGIERVRFTSPHPADMHASAIEAMRDCPKISPYLHLPVQSASDRMLEAMDRGHTIAEYRELVIRLREAVPTLALSTDIIVGYPGETDEEFEATAALMEEIGYDHAFMFKYSPREGTRAFRLEDSVPEKVKSERLTRLIEEQTERAAFINRAMVGCTTEVLVEGSARRQEGWLAGKNEQYKTVVFEPCEAKIGDIVDVEIEAAGSHTLRGKEVVGTRR